jgi:hypothetical protein
LAYAEHLSTDVHRRVHEGFREWVEEEANPDLKAVRAIEGYRRRGKDDAWIAARLDGLVRRGQLTDDLKAHGVEGAGYAICTDAINQEVLGMSAREIKQSLGLAKSASVRDRLSEGDLDDLRIAEVAARRRVNGQQARGNLACARACREAAAATRKFLDSMGSTEGGL